MRDILTVTLNPAVDISTSVAHVVPGPKLRCDFPDQDPGGGGTNVARAITFMGGQARAFMALGGLNGRKLRAMVEAEGIELVAIEAPDETRISLSVTDRQSNQQFRFVLPGPSWGAGDADMVAEAIAGAAHSGGFVVLSGSLPAGLPEDFYVMVARALRGRDVRIILDTSGPALAHQAGAPSPAPYLLRMDENEAEALAGRPLPERTDTADFAAALVGKGAAEVVVVARGAEGSVLAARGLRLHAAAADVKVVSKVGAGDSFVGGMSLALARGGDLGEALRWGTAAASAAVMTPASRLCRHEDVEALLPQCTVTSL